MTQTLKELKEKWCVCSMLLPGEAKPCFRCEIINNTYDLGLVDGVFKGQKKMLEEFKLRYQILVPNDMIAVSHVVGTINLLERQLQKLWQMVCCICDSPDDSYTAYCAEHGRVSHKKKEIKP